MHLKTHDVFVNFNCLLQNALVIKDIYSASTVWNSEFSYLILGYQTKNPRFISNVRLTKWGNFWLKHAHFWNCFVFCAGGNSLLYLCRLQLFLLLKPNLCVKAKKSVCITSKLLLFSLFFFGFVSVHLIKLKLYLPPWECAW